MPSKNIVKIYVKDGIYHVYNRGVEERNIFIDEQDFKVFLYYLKSYLLPPDHPTHKKLPRNIRFSCYNCDLWKRIKLLAYCLMPNHFHLLLKQTDEQAMTEFVKRLSNAYVKYFNKKYKRVGSLFQGAYKAALVDKENYYLYVTRYIHRNPGEILEELGLSNLKDYSYSSYADYLGERKTEWVRPREILDYFQDVKKTLPSVLTYRSFVEDDKIDDKEFLDNLTIG